jgi:lipopolysaccharide transport system ATP-binding protein
MPSSIQIEAISKHFVRYHRDRPPTLKEALLRGWGGVRGANRFLALREVSLTVAAGEIVGIIGRNGAGKSTLLRLVGGIGRPDSGGIVVNGRISALLELGAGFHPDLTGRENVFITGVIAGLSRAEVTRRFDAIVDFAELEPFIDSPLRTYSSGMQLRLAFAVGVHTSPEILLIDEVLAVGDLAFQRKCVDRIMQFKRNGCAILLVSHDLTQVKSVCDRVSWLKDGRVVAEGHAADVIADYERAMLTQTHQRGVVQPVVQRASTGVDLRLNENRFGTLEVEITSVRLLNAAGTPVTAVGSGSPLAIELAFSPTHPITHPLFSVTISDTEGRVCFDTNTADLAMPTLEHAGLVRLSIERLDLTGGDYYVDVGSYAADWEHILDYHWHVYPLMIEATAAHKGVLNPPHQWHLLPSGILPE